MAWKKMVSSGCVSYVTITEILNEYPASKRARKKNLTNESVKKINRKLAERHAALILCGNYEDEDLHAIFTYAEESTPEEAKREFKNLIRRLKRMYQNAGTPFKWFAVTEYRNQRIHHHIILKKANTEEIRKRWSHGWVFIRALGDCKDHTPGDYRRLAAYLIKETDKTFRETDALQRKRYSHSRNMTMPEMSEPKKVRREEIRNEPTARKGYYIDQNSIFRGYSPFTDHPYLYYVEIKINGLPQKKRHKKRQQRYREYYYPLPEPQTQMNIFDIGTSPNT